MIKEAETMEEADKEIKEKVDAKNSFENYLYQMRRSIEDKDKLSEKISEEDKNAIQEALTDSQDWFNANEEAATDEYNDKLKEIQSICDPIISKIYQD